MRLPDWSRERWLLTFDAAVLASVGGMAFGGSATHVYHLAREHGQAGFGAVSVTTLAEILFAYSGLEVRRREGWAKGVPVFWLILTAAFVVWANLRSTGDHSFTGYIVAIAPAVVFVGVATTAETRSWGAVAPASHRPEREAATTRGGATAPVHPAMSPKVAPAPTVSVAAKVAPQPQVVSRVEGDATTRAQRQVELHAVGRAWVASQATAQPLARQDIARRLGVSPQRAGLLISRWRDDPQLLSEQPSSDDHERDGS
jgi:hypothetical protein